MAQKSRPPDTKQPFAFGSFRNWVRLLWRSGGPDGAYARRVLFVLLVSLITIPCRLYERARYGRVAARLTIRETPIFIIGHWRSGGTYLHHLMCQDKNLGYVSTFQTIAPDLFLTGEKTLKPIVARMIPSTRMMDNVALSIDTPQEEEFGVAEMLPYSFYHHWSFPRRAREYFEKYALFRDLPQTVLARWKKAYMTILRKATWRAGNRRLVLKNPANTGRIRVLLELFPDAKFIHLYRNPYLVFLSTLNFYEKTLAVTQVQHIGRDEIEENVLLFYQEIMQKFLAEQDLIPPENLVEVRFEDLEANPLAELRRIYRRLGLPGFAAAEASFVAYIASQASYRKNRYNLDAAAIEKVNRRWQFAVEKWGYAPLGRQPGRPGDRDERE